MSAADKEGAYAGKNSLLYKKYLKKWTKDNFIRVISVRNRTTVDLEEKSMSILKEKKSCSGIGSDARVEVVDRSQEHSGKFSGKDVFAKNGGEQ